MMQQFRFKSSVPAVDNIDIFGVVRDKDYKHSFKNGRGKHGFIYVARGKMRDAFSDGESVELCAGDLMFIPKGCRYSAHYLENETQIKIVQFDLRADVLPPYLCAPMKIAIPNAEEYVRAFFDADIAAAQSAFYYSSHLYGLLWCMERRCSPMQTKYTKLKKALSHIARYPEKNMPVSFYADLSDMSEVNFRRLFKEYTGKSPIGYRNALRLESARARLQSGEYNVSEAAESVGFSNLSFFTRLYKKQYGHTPKKE